MMDTILNLGLNDKTVEDFPQRPTAFCVDCYRRFIQMYGDVVMEFKPAMKPNRTFPRSDGRPRRRLARLRHRAFG
ncbi:MAG: hypothetical protein ACLUKN_12165 [Bacilli bacterium]